MSKATKPSLLEAINAATADDLAEIDEQIATHERSLDGLKAARKIIDVRLNGKRTSSRNGGGGGRRG